MKNNSTEARRFQSIQYCTVVKDINLLDFAKNSSEVSKQRVDEMKCTIEPSRSFFGFSSSREIVHSLDDEVLESRA